MKHAILGAGAIGGLIGTVLASLGEEVTVIVRPESLAEYPGALTLDRPSGPLAARATAASTLTSPCDILWIATKTYQLDAALETVQSTPGTIIPLLNGIDHVAALRARFGDQRVAPATIAVEAEKIAPGRFLQRSAIVRLNLAASTEPLLGSIVSQLDNIGFVSKFVANEQTLLWGKLCFLGPFALVTSASGMNVGEILADLSWKQKLNAAVAEACAVANASGAQVDPLRILEGFKSAPTGMRSSMQKDLVSGRQLELDAIGGPIISAGKHHGIDVPTTAELMAAIRAKLN